MNARYKWVQKSTEESALNENIFGHYAVFPVTILPLDSIRIYLKFKNQNYPQAAQITFYYADEKLHNLYRKNPMAVEVYLRLYPSMMMDRKK